jgi:hypothetical protein
MPFGMDFLTGGLVGDAFGGAAFFGGIGWRFIMGRLLLAFAVKYSVL